MNFRAMRHTGECQSESNVDESNRGFSKQLKGQCGGENLGREDMQDVKRKLIRDYKRQKSEIKKCITTLCALYGEYFDILTNENGDIDRYLDELGRIDREEKNCILRYEELNECERTILATLKLEKHGFDIKKDSWGGKREDESEFPNP